MYRGGGGFAKPENALKRAEELEKVGQKQAALKALHDVLTSKRHKQWQKALELIMFKYVELCVELKTGRMLKDGLIQYRNSCQQDNVQSLEEVIKRLLKLAHEKAESAKAASDAADLEVEDLEVETSPEDLMLSYVSGDSDKDRKERKDVMPWFKFLWETYRNTLDILRNNSRLEALYAMTAIRAYNFCATYNRTTEFKRACEIIRNHLANLNKYADQRDKPDLQQSETLALYMETRFEQLRVAAKLGLWQEAFRTVEDIHGLTMLGKRSPKPQMMAIYYANLTKVFWISEKYLYNAYAWYKLFNISRTYNKNLQEKDLELMATAVVLSTLSILPYEAKTSHGFHEVELEREKARRVANLLGFATDSKQFDAREALSRSALLAELRAKGVIKMATPEAQELFNMLETGFHPLDLCKKAQTLLNKIQETETAMSEASPISEIQFEQFIKQLQHVSTLKMVHQISQVYTTVKLDFISERVVFYDFGDVERLLVDAVRNAHLQIRIDHRNKVVKCGSHTTESENVKNHLSLLAQGLNEAVCMIHKGSVDQAKQDRKTKAIEEMKAQVESEHKRILARKVIIERRKEEYEQMLQEKEREEENKRLELERVRAEEEKKRLQNESAKREEERIRREMEDQELEETRALMEAARSRGKAFKEGEKVDKVQLRQQAIQEQIKERQDQARRLHRLSKSFDHFERAKREEQVDLLMKLHEKRMEDDLEYQKHHKKELLEKHKAKWEKDLSEKKRLTKLLAEKEIFQQQLLEKREEFYRAEEEAMRREIEARKKELKAQRILARKKEYVRRCREEEEMRIRIEEEEKRKAEQEARRKEEEERMRLLDEQYEKQRQREAEIMARRERDRGAYEPRRGGGGGGGGDRWGGPSRGGPPPRGGPPSRDDGWGGRGGGPSGPRGFEDRRGPPPSGPRGFEDRRGPPSRGFEPRGGPRGFQDRRDGPPRRDGPEGERRGYDRPAPRRPDSGRW